MPFIRTNSRPSRNSSWSIVPPITAIMAAMVDWWTTLSSILKNMVEVQLGVETEKDYPYKARSMNCLYNEAKEIFKVKNWLGGWLCGYSSGFGWITYPGFIERPSECGHRCRREKFLILQWRHLWSALRQGTQPWGLNGGLWAWVLLDQELMGYDMGREWLYSNETRPKEWWRHLWNSDECQLPYQNHRYLTVFQRFYISIVFNQKSRSTFLLISNLKIDLLK